MSRKNFGFLVAMVLFFSLSTPRVAMSGAMPEAGDAVYRDIDTDTTSIKLVGHAGMCIGNFEVIHMQWPKIQKVDLTNFYPDYWGSFYAGNSKAAENRVKEAKRLLGKSALYSFINYKGFVIKEIPGSYPSGRCDGLIEHCYAIAGNDIVPNDNGWSTLTPQKQWKSSKITKRYTTARGKTAYASSLITIDSTLEKLL